MNTDSPAPVQEDARQDSCPFVGPRSIQEGEPFYGRENDRAALVNRFLSEQILLMYSPSGAGKSSLIQAGLIPDLAQFGYTALPVIRLGIPPPAGADDANRFVVSAIQSMEKSGGLGLSENEIADRGLTGYVDERVQKLHAEAKQQSEEVGRIASEAESDPGEQAATDTLPTPVLIFDQFEELITADRFGIEAIEQFMRELGSMMRELRPWVLFSIRQEYLAEFDPYREHVPTRLSSTFHLELLSHEAALRSIKGPAKQYHRPFDDDAAEQVLTELTAVDEKRTSPFVEPLHLQVVCRRIWEQTAGQSKIHLDAVKKADNVDKALLKYYDTEVARAQRASGEIPERAIREWFQSDLIDQGVRRVVAHGPRSLAHRDLSVPAADHDEGVDRDPNPFEEPALKHLLESHVVRKVPRSDHDWLELSHDRLVEPVTCANDDWFDKNLAQWQVDLMRRPAGDENEPVLRGPELADALDELASDPGQFTDEERRHLARSRKARWWRRVVAFLVLLVIGTVVALVVWAVVERSTALDRARDARAEQLAGEAISVTDQNLAIMLALSAAESTDGELRESAGTALHNATSGRLLSALRPGGEELRGTLVASSVDSTLIVADDATLSTVNTERTLPATTLHQFDGPISLLAARPDSRDAATIAGDAFWVTADGSWTRLETAVGAPVSLTYGISGDVLGVAGSRGVQRFDAEGAAIGFTEFNPAPTHLAAIAEGFAVADENGVVFVLDSEGTKKPLEGRNGRAGTMTPGDLVAQLAASPSGDELAVARMDGVVERRVGDTLVPTQLITATPARQVEFVSERLLAWVETDDTIQVAEWTSGTRVGVLVPNTGTITSISALQGDRIAAATTQGAVTIWNVEMGHLPELTRLASVDPDDEVVYSVGGDAEVIRWSLTREGVERQASKEITSDDETATITALAADDKGALIASGRTITLLSEDGTQQVQRTHESTVRVLTPWRSGFLSASEDGVVKVGEAEGRDVFSLDTEGEEGERLVTVAASETANLFAILTVKDVATDPVTTAWTVYVTTPGGAVTSREDSGGEAEWTTVALLHDCLLIGNATGVVEARPVGGRQEGCVPSFGEGLARVNSLAIGGPDRVSDGASRRRVAVATADGSTEVWDVAIDDQHADRRLVTRASTPGVQTVQLIDDGSRLVAPAGGRVNVYSVDRDRLLEDARRRLSRWPTERECDRYELIEFTINGNTRTC